MRVSRLQLDSTHIAVVSPSSTSTGLNTEDDIEAVLRECLHSRRKAIVLR
jgi:hypothetical protein